MKTINVRYHSQPEWQTLVLGDNEGDKEQLVTIPPSWRFRIQIDDYVLGLRYSVKDYTEVEAKLDVARHCLQFLHHDIEFIKTEG